jgi:hypothetical protein
MKGWRERIESWLTAVTFAEAGESEIALQLVDSTPAPKRQLSLDDLMTAITFAEAGIVDKAREFLGVKEPASPPACLELPGIKIWCGMVPVEEPVSLGLPGVKIWYGMATINT